MQSVNLRHARTGDAGPLARLAAETYAAAFGPSMSEADLAAHLHAHLSPEKIAEIIRRDTVLIAETSQRLLGYCQVGPAGGEIVQAHPGDFQLFRLYVSAEFQN